MSRVVILCDDGCKVEKGVGCANDVGLEEDERNWQWVSIGSDESNSTERTTYNGDFDIDHATSPLFFNHRTGIVDRTEAVSLIVGNATPLLARFGMRPVSLVCRAQVGSRRIRNVVRWICVMEYDTSP